MLAKRSIALTDAALLPEPILRREDIAGSLRACEVLSDARRQAQQMLVLQEEESGRRHAQALASFWETANGFLAELKAERGAFEQQAMDTLEALLNEALRHLLDETTLAERTRALVKNLAASQPDKTVATLSAHPDMLEPLQEWLAQSRFSEHWQVRGDATIASGSLRLSDANGAFDIDWASLRDGLLSADRSD